MSGLPAVAVSGGYALLQHMGVCAWRLLLLRSTGSVRGLQRSRHAGSVVVEHRLSCSMACTVFLDQGSNPCPLHWQVDFYPLYQQGGPVLFIFEIISY